MLSATSSTITGNNISGGNELNDWGRFEDYTSALQVSGHSTVTSNVIWSSKSPYSVLIQGGNTVLSGNNIRTGVRVAGDASVENNLLAGGIQVGDIYINAFNSINYGFGNSIIQNNIISGSVSSSYSGGTATIENNLISAGGISLNSIATIQNNTLTNSSITLQTYQYTIKYNNIVNYNQYSLTLSNITSSVDAAYNWWGTTDQQTIGLTIYDSKYNINLGTVNIAPILTALNPQAPSTSYSLNVPTYNSNATTIISAQTPTATTNPTATQTANPVPNSTLTSKHSGSNLSTSNSSGNSFTIPAYFPWILVIVLVAVIIVLLFMRKREK